MTLQNHIATIKRYLNKMCYEAKQANEPRTVYVSAHDYEIIDSTKELQLYSWIDEIIIRKHDGVMNCLSHETYLTKRDTPLDKPQEKSDTSPLDVQVAGSHYKKLKIQPVEFIHANDLGFLEGCVIKRLCRWKNKDGIQDLQKAKHEIDLLIELHTRNQEKA